MMPLTIEAYENGETEVYFYDDEEGETNIVEVNEESYAEASEAANLRSVAAGKV